MWHIELVKNKYESLEDLYSLLQYVFRLNKTADDSRRANIITDDLTGCLPAMIPDINNPDMVYRLMLFIIQRRHKDTIKQKLENAKTHAEFDKLLQEISAVDAEIDHDNLTSEQKTHYDQLNKSCTDTISAKMRQLEYKDNIDYNKKAVNAYNSAFTSFKNNESRYKDKSQLFGLVSTTLFAYDAGRLFNETLIFYNHVYSYIFSKLDDNGKLELTRYSIECERKLR